MANDSGVNQFGGLSAEKVQGEVKRLTQLTSAAPMAGAPSSALNTPRRSQRRAVKGDTSGEPISAPPSIEPSYKAQLSEIWRQLAQETEDPLVRTYAERAQK